MYDLVIPCLLEVWAFPMQMKMPGDTSDMPCHFVAIEENKAICVHSNTSCMTRISLRFFAELTAEVSTWLQAVQTMRVAGGICQFETQGPQHGACLLERERPVSVIFHHNTKSPQRINDTDILEVISWRHAAHHGTSKVF